MSTTVETPPAAPSGALGRVRGGVRRHGVVGFATRGASRALAPALAPLAARRLSRKGSATADIDALVDLAFGFDELGVRLEPGQVRGEITGLLELVRPLRPRRILEIGTHRGGSLFMFAHVAAPDAHLISIDLPHGEFGGGYPAWRVPLYKRFGQRRQRIDLIRGDSHADATFERVQRLLGGERLDFLFVDGDHAYDGVRADFERYGGLVRPGGLIALHDIAPERAEGSLRERAEQEGLVGGDVPRFWREIRDRHRTTELESYELGFFGIGVVYVD